MNSPQQDLFVGPSGRTSQASYQTSTTPLAASLALLSDTTPPSCRLTAKDGGQTQVWLSDPGREQLGGFSMLNISDWPNDGGACSLSSVLETGPIPSKYFLSPKACLGLLRRATARGKTLPQLLLLALQQVADLGRIAN